MEGTQRQSASEVALTRRRFLELPGIGAKAAAVASVSYLSGILRDIDKS